MNVRQFDSYEAMSRYAAFSVAAQIRQKPDSVLGLATGSTPIGLYDGLAQLYQEGLISFRRVTTFNLDEYIGIAEDHAERYYNFMMRNLFSKVDIKPENINIPDSRTNDPDGECKRYEEKYRKTGGADLAVLGIGQNGHIGFNEPGTPFSSVTHVTSIAESTVKANSRFFASEAQVPKKAMTMGISTILSAKKIILLATGKSKHDILIKLLQQTSANESIPATALLLHDDAVIYADREAITG